MASFVPIFTLLFMIPFCRSDDQLTRSKPLTHGDTLISKSGYFALGFFSPTSSSKNLYLGIWYNNIPGPRTVVWIANRDNPITAPSSAMLTITNSSRMLLSGASNNGALWVANNNVTGAGEAAGSYAVLLDSGNFVLRSPNDSDVWQSFDHPTDTVLPTMKFLQSYKGRAVGRLVAWKGPDDPSSGDFSVSGDHGSPALQNLIWHGTQPYCRGNVLYGMSVSGGTYQSNASSIIYQTVINQGEELYIMFTVSDGLPFTRVKLDYRGKANYLAWSNHSSSWTILSEIPKAACDLYASCGPFSYCDFSVIAPSCRCLDGFEPDGLNHSRGCRRTEELECGKESHFITLPDMKVPDRFLHIKNRSFQECVAECSANCSCLAYAYANLSSAGAKADPSRCLVWTGELIDTAKSRSPGENLYLRLANSSVQHNSSLDSKEKKDSNLVKIVLPSIAFLLIFTCVALLGICKYRGRWFKKEVQKRPIEGYVGSFSKIGENIEFPHVSFEDIAMATNNFSDSNQIGRGGFGKVYKGMLEAGKEVAIKRLSKSSGQGTEEFKNEIVLIAKLQHKNLVRLLGCCIHGEERLLIYEYLPNKSLDTFLFDATKHHVLDWPTRFKIIKGVARGILYLHQDSRLTIIHRDLKVSNILLDAEMNPKISDFGMARIFDGNQNQANTTRVVGTYGYMSPEYAMRGDFSVKSDTYSFGVLLFEIVSGLKINSPELTANFNSLIAYAWRLWENGKATELMNSSFAESCPVHQVLRCIHVGLLCVQDSAADRPVMSSVIFMLENESAALPAPKQPVFFVQPNVETQEEGKNIANSINAMSMTTLHGR